MPNREKVFVIGGGPSLIGFDFNKLIGHDTIAINHSLFDIPDPNYFITMDYLWLTKSGVQPKAGMFDFARRKHFIQSLAEKYFILGFSPPRLEEKGGRIYYDREQEQEYDLRLFDKVVVASEYGGIGTSIRDFHCASDSGYSGLQLGIALGYKQIYLLGMDFLVAYNTTHYKKECGRKDLRNYQLMKLNLFLDAYPKAFADIEQKTESQVYVCSEISRLRAYCPYIPIEEAL